MRARLPYSAILAGLVALTIACSGDRQTVSAPTALPESTTAAGAGPQGPFQATMSWTCFTGGEPGRVLSGTNEWSLASEPCPGVASDAVRNRPTSNGEAIFAPGPSNFRATVTGSTVLLQWDQGPGASGWQIEGGSGPGLSNLAVQRIGPILNFAGGTVPFTVGGVPNGVYFVRVRSTRPDFSDVSVPSNEIVVTVGSPGCTAPPGAPTGLTSAVNGNNVTLLWSPPATGSAPSAYLLEVGTSPGSSDILVFDTGTSATSLQGVAPPRAYFVRLRSRNACGTSAAAATATVIVGATTTSTVPTTTTVPNPNTTTTIPQSNTTTTIISQPTTTTSTTVPGATTSTSTSTTSSSTSSTTSTSVPAAPTATFSFSPNPCTITGSNAVQDCTLNASGSNPGSGNITAYLWTYLNVTDEATTSATHTPNLGGCGLSGGQQVNFPVTLKVRNSANVVSQPFSIPGGMTVKKVGACGFGQ